MNFITPPHQYVLSDETERKASVTFVQTFSSLVVSGLLWEDDDVGWDSGLSFGAVCGAVGLSSECLEHRMIMVDRM